MKATRLSFEPRSREKFDLHKVLHDLAHWLPSQGPVKDFIHQHPLHGFQKQPFESAVWQASRMFGAFAYMPPSYYQQAYREGRLAKRELERVFALRQVPKVVQELALARLEKKEDEPLVQPPLGMVKDGIRSQWKQVHGVDLETLSQPLLFKLLGAFLDQGISSRRFPTSTDFFQGVGNLAQNSYLPLGPLSDRAIRRLFQEPVDRVILHCLEKLVGDPALYERYLHEMFLSHLGWYAMVYMIDHDPTTLMSRRVINLEQTVAVELLIELGWMIRQCGEGFTPLAQAIASLPASKESPYSHVDDCIGLWHEAFEWTHYSEVLRALQVQAGAPRTSLAPPSVQAFFCIDDRECSVRRYMEELDPHLQTFGTAGFFAVDFMFQGISDSQPVKQCPLPVTPHHVVREIVPENRRVKRLKLSHSFHLDTLSNTLIRGWLTTQVIGIWSAFKLVLSIVKPTLSQPTLSSLSRIDATSDLHLYRNGDEKTETGLYVGYSIPEMADRVGNVLSSNGLVKDFAELIIIVGHGSSSTNNPHFAAYDCGACSGRAGAPNSRAFAIMANDSKVREILAARGIEIPPSTRFVGCIHDTARDEIQYFDATGFSEGQTKLFAEFTGRMKTALALNAKERCRRFELVSGDITPKRALEEVKKRSAALFEPRPELNHATNSLTIVGRRPLTYRLFLDRRALLQSYDPFMDKDGNILQSLLGALVPVCGGINLQYVFSRIDNEVYGAGTKLPHNIVSLLGVANGVEGDIRTGLPAQMVEIHDPIRLLMVVEQEPEIALAALKREPALYEWVENYWMRYAAMSPTTHQIFCFIDGKMVPIDVSDLPEPLQAKDSVTLLASGNRDNIAVHRLGGGR